MSEDATALPHLSKYRVVARLGQGGMGSVYLGARHGQSELRVIKIINEDLIDNETVAQRFLREAHVTSNLVHPNIARLTDAGREDDGRLYLAMELIHGDEFEALMRLLMAQGKMVPPGLTLAIAQDVLRGLAYAHDLAVDGQPLSIVHRDLSPRNVMVDFEGHGRIIDFGLVRSSLGDWKTKPGMLLGTLRYMSPEQATATPADHRSDLYSFAVVLYEALSGSFWVPDGELVDLLGHIVAEVPPPLSELNPQLPLELTPVLQRALQKAPEDRFEDAETFREALLAAAPDLSATPRADIGAFMKACFPDKVAKLEATRAQLDAQTTEVRDAPANEPTRAGVALTDDDQPEVESTRTAALADLAVDRAAPAPEGARPPPVPAVTFPAPPVSAPLPPPPAGGRRVTALAAAVGLIAAALLAALLLLGPDDGDAVEATLPSRPPSEAAASERPQPRVDPKAAAVSRPPEPPPRRAPAGPAPERANAPTPRPAPVKTPDAPPPAASPPEPPPSLVAVARARARRGDYEGARDALLQAAKGLPADEKELLEDCLRNASKFGPPSRDRNYMDCAFFAPSLEKK